MGGRGNRRGEFKPWGFGSSAEVGFVCEGYLGVEGFRLEGFEGLEISARRGFGVLAGVVCRRGGNSTEAPKSICAVELLLFGRKLGGGIMRG